MLLQGDIVIIVEMTSNQMSVVIYLKGDKEDMTEKRFLLENSDYDLKLDY